MNFLEYYFIFINLTGFFLFGIDKSKARRRDWRISEKTLFAAAILGGCPGCLAGMYFFRHKTRHRSFVIGLPAILLLQVLLFFLFTGNGIRLFLP